MLININKKAEELKLKAPDLITRHVGRAMYESIKKIVENINDGETLVLDFNGIKVIDSSCIDEMIVKLILDSRKSKPSFYIKLKNISEIAEINIDLVFRSYYSYKNKKIVVITENICQNNVFFIGHLSDQERDMVEFLRVNKSITMDDAVTFTGLPREKVQKIMDELDKIRIVKSIKGVFFAV
jgi:anti-anti-sigma regulatory factor